MLKKFSPKHGTIYHHPILSFSFCCKECESFYSRSSVSSYNRIPSSGRLLTEPDDGSPTLQLKPKNNIAITISRNAPKPIIQHNKPIFFCFLLVKIFTIQETNKKKKFLVKQILLLSYIVFCLVLGLQIQFLF